MTERVLDDRTLALLAASLRPVPFAPERRLALRQRVLQRVGATQIVAAPAIGRTLRADEGDWRTLLPGLHLKILRRDRAAGELTALWKLDPGATIPAHAHRVDEECLVVSGRVCIGDLEYGAGDYVLAAAGSRHPEFSSREGTVLLIRGEDPFVAHAPHV